jgi:hypothetical protein
LSITHRCDRPEPVTASSPWRCPDCGTLWEPLPAAAVTSAGAGSQRTWSERLATVGRVACAAFILIFFASIGMTVASVAMLIGVFLVWGISWTWTWFRIRQSRR